MVAASANQFPKVILEEVATDGSATTTPAADHRALFLGEDGGLHLKDSAAAVTDVGGGTPDAHAASHENGGSDEIDVTGLTGAGGGVLAYIRIEDQKAQNTAGGTFTTGAWQTRVLNTEVTDTGANCTLAANQITLAAGDYECLISCPGSFVDGHQARLMNVTDTAVVILGQNAYSSANETDVTSTLALVRGVFTIAASKALEVQHRCQVTRATNGFGSEMNWGTEVYTVAEFWRRA